MCEPYIPTNHSRVRKSKRFQRFARKEGIGGEDLPDAMARAERGLGDADLRGGVFKQRIAREGQGKSGGFRTILFCRRGDRAVFVCGFAKNGRDNLTVDEAAILTKPA